MSSLPFGNEIENLYNSIVDHDHEHEDHQYSDQFLNPLTNNNDHLDEYSWPLFMTQEILHTSEAANIHNVEQRNSEAQQENAAAAGTTLLDKGLKLMKISTNKTRKKNSIKLVTCNKNANDDDDAAEQCRVLEEGASSSSVAKKLDHNAKERIRRMKLNASYLALRALLPDSRRSKKRLGAPAIVDRVLKYIPALENEVEELKSNKENAQLAAAAKTKKIISRAYDESDHLVTVSINKINKEEAIVQICMPKEDEDQDGILAFTNLLRSLEDDEEGITGIKSASTNYVCDTTVCYHLHIQINETSSEANYIQELRDKILLGELSRPRSSKIRIINPNH